jgi:hypothetical protein
MDFLFSHWWNNTKTQVLKDLLLCQVVRFPAGVFFFMIKFRSSELFFRPFFKTPRWNEDESWQARVCIRKLWIARDTTTWKIQGELRCFARRRFVEKFIDCSDFHQLPDWRAFAKFILCFSSLLLTLPTLTKTDQVCMRVDWILLSKKLSQLSSKFEPVQSWWESGPARGCSELGSLLSFTKPRRTLTFLWWVTWLTSMRDKPAREKSVREICILLLLKLLLFCYSELPWILLREARIQDRVLGIRVSWAFYLRYMVSGFGIFGYLVSGSPPHLGILVSDQKYTRVFGYP